MVVTRLGWPMLFAVMSSLLVAARSGSAEEPQASAPVDPAAAQFFETKIRPLLAAQCYKCHGPDKQNGELRLDSLQAMLTGGDSGPAIEPGKASESLLVQAINYESLEMPPSGKLKPEQIALIAEWVNRGAPWPNAGPVRQVARPAREITDEDRQYWAFRPRVRPPVPDAASDWITNEIDSFVLARLQEKNLSPSQPATRRELIRRASFDLVGLPPTPEEVAAFEQDSSPDAYQRLLDRLLASPAYGERWGRHWLDLVRFAQTEGYERDNEKPHAWRYRDYVIRSLNEDKPYDRFVLEQLAGDELPDANDQSLTATAFYRLGVWDDEPDDRRQAEFDGLDDMLSTAGSAFLGLTIGCARCHDHKFDPILQEDYYSMLAFLRNVTYYGEKGADTPKTHLAKLSGGEETLAVTERGPQAPPTHVLIRGDAGAPGKQVKPRFVQVLCPTSDAASPRLPGAGRQGKTSGRRLVLAEWIASAEHPLTARVIANRLWHYHFGRGIVPTPSDFGLTGLPPSHPELLDWLASEVVDGGWRLKRMHKLIMMSSAYRQSSRAANVAALDVDPDNELLWRQNLRRLEAEALRDAILATSGRLNLKQGGRGIFPELSQEVLSTQSRPGNGWDNKTSIEEQSRRSVYIFVKRTLGVPLMETFDAASPDQPIASRARTTIAPQALILLNSNFMERQARDFAERLLAIDSAQEAHIEQAYRIALGRLPTRQERSIAAQFLERQTAQWERVGSSKDIAKAPPASGASDSVQLDGWSNFEGVWRLRTDGGYEVEPHRGAKSIWDGLLLADGVVECEFMLLEGNGDAGLVLRAQSPAIGTDALTAYNVNFRKDALRLGKHQNNWRQLVSAPYTFAGGSWHKVRVELAGNVIRVYVGDDDQPAIEYEDPEVLPPGKVGLRTFQIQSAFRNLKITTDEKPIAVPFEPAAANKTGQQAPAAVATTVDPAYRQALASFCKLVLNLNEFVYID